MSYHTTQGYSIGEKFNKKEFCLSWNTKHHSVVHFCFEARMLLLRKNLRRDHYVGQRRPSYMWFLKVNRSSVVVPKEQLWHMLKLEITAALTVKYSWGCLIVLCQAPILAQTFRWGPVYSSGLQLFMTGIIYKCISPQIVFWGFFVPQYRYCFSTVN